MDKIEKNQKEFVGYEYKEVIAESSKASFIFDAYENFGWELDEKLNGNIYENPVKNIPSPYQKKIVIRLKRNRKISNKMELTRLQRNFEACVNEIEELEKSKTSAATIYALVIVILGTSFMAGSVFAVTAQPPHIVLCILLAIPGFIGWIIPYFVYKKTVKKQTEKVIQLIEEKYDEIYKICEKGNKLLHQ
ncbi:hypothetical protein H9L25_03230 [Terrisporobacter mayombei]|nr:hypothetical protein [Terrisporobacter mayombei]